MKPSKKHQRIIKDYDKQKEKHLEKLATRLLKDDERNQKLKDKPIDPGFLNLF
jgi:hypothetical protein